ncbi:DUF551 domain-containing protein [Dorea longicatena]|jgi:hypothetical protein|uniref:DUF551 domain-containing protein n=1 Tax=Dorea longicatena TaxID=88431 RepID=A0A414S2X3_9FIRM|nr:DUF551 domain-containing protein [Dorea longicatena]RHG09475.1 DUF551 domain-containing protein [Dorea longicatena]DAE56820.1 MAG TPA: Protein of unknown function (DUF551) [Caudoviricetes sp.]
MERLTHERKSGMKTGYWSPNKKQELVDRLAMYEDREDAKDTNVPGKWIPCNERLPEVNIPVLAQWGIYYSGENRIEILYLNEFGRWHGDLGEPNGKVIAWMPLPTPYEKGE